MCGIWAEWVVGEKDLQVDNSVEVRRVVKRESESDGKRVWTLWGVSDGVGREGMGPGGGWGVGRGVGLGGQLGGVERGRERERERERENFQNNSVATPRLLGRASRAEGWGWRARVEGRPRAVPTRRTA